MHVPERDPLAFLAPSEKLGSLGRLDHYEILERIGSGGFGIVLKALDEKLGERAQAQERVGGREGHKGEEAAATAIEMVSLLRNLP